MKQGLNPRRSRGRGNPRGRQPNGGGGNRNHQFDSNGPEGRIRGSAAQILERYLALARDAQTAGDTVSAENLFQHAEHYFRVINVNGGGQQGQQGRQEGPATEDDVVDGNAQPEFNDGRGRPGGIGGGGSSEGWRQNRGRDDQHLARGDERPRQRPPERSGERPIDRPGDRQAERPQENLPERQHERPQEQHRQREAEGSRPETEADPPEVAATRTVEADPPAGEKPRRRVQPARDDLSEHRPAFLRRRGPVAGPPPDETATLPQTAEKATAERAEVTAPEAASSAREPEVVEGAAETAAKPKARRRRTVAEGDAAPKTPRRRSTAKSRTEDGEEQASKADPRDLERSV